MIAADEARRVAQAANSRMRPCARWPTARRRSLRRARKSVEFDGADGSLEFDSASSVRAVAAFYRSR